MRIFPASLLQEISQDFSNHIARRDSSWYGYTNGKKWGAIPFAVRSLYRGQNEHHLPLLPSIARDLRCQDIFEIWKCPIEDQAKIVFRVAQSWWFAHELAKHPIAHSAKQQKLELDEIALAQHYGIPTGYLDLSDNFRVAAFFATCHLTNEGWEPVPAGVGIMYQVALKTLESPFGPYTPLGPQPLPRPTEQGAWVVQLPLCHSFEGWPEVYALKFQHDRQIGEYFLDMFEGGSQLFPADPLSEVASEILSCREIPADILEGATDSFAQDPLGIRPDQIAAIRTAIASRCAITNGRNLLTERHVANLTSDDVWRAKMLGEVRVKWRAVRRVPISQELPDA